MNIYDTSHDKRTMVDITISNNERLARASLDENSNQSQEFYCLPEPVSTPVKMKRRPIPDYSSLTAFDFTLLRQSRGYSSMRLPAKRSSSNLSSIRTSLDDSKLKRTRKNSVESDDSNKQDVRMATSQYESEFWTPPFLRKKSRLSYAEEATAAEEGSFCSDESSSITKIKQKICSSFSNMSLEKYREKHWYCYSCRRPKDRCKCMCSVS